VSSTTSTLVPESPGGREQQVLSTILARTLSSTCSSYNCDKNVPLFSNMLSDTPSPVHTPTRVRAVGTDSGRAKPPPHTWPCLLHRLPIDQECLDCHAASAEVLIPDELGGRGHA
jgi:hypothetical protein